MKRLRLCRNIVALVDRFDPYGIDDTREDFFGETREEFLERMAQDLRHNPDQIREALNDLEKSAREGTHKDRKRLNALKRRAEKMGA